MVQTRFHPHFRLSKITELLFQRRLGSINPYSGGQTTADGYAQGYGKYAQDVLIPAFIAAYSGKSPNTIALVTGRQSEYQV